MESPKPKIATEQTQIKEDEINNSVKDKKLKLFLGDFTDLPKRFPRMVRIFLSSTFSDFELERNFLIEDLYQNLQEFCTKEYHLDFSLVDMRWGITDESTSQNKTTEICLKEIKRCKLESIGPTFIAFLGYKYGNRFLQSFISFNEYKELRKELDDLKSKSTVNMKYKKITQNLKLEIEDLMDYCYELDENQLPSVNYETCSEVWSEMQNLLLKNIKIAVRNLYNKKIFDYKQFKSYFISITEIEIDEGIFEEAEKNDKTIVFCRKFSDYEQFVLQDKEATKKYLEHNKESNELLQLLKNTINEKLPHDNICELSQVGWFKSDRLDPNNEATKAYLKAFGEEFLFKLKHLIEFNYRKTKENSSYYENSSLFEEVNHHLSFCQKLLKKFYARDTILEKITEYVYGDKNTPFILYGESGSGKSSLVASLVAKLKSDESFDSAVIVRFMGTSRESCRAYDVLKSINEQLEYILKSFDKTYDIDSTLNQAEFKDKIDMRNYLKALLDKLKQICPEKRIIILLDSIDQLSKLDYDTKWILFELPPNTKMIYTARSGYESFLDKIKSKFFEENSYELRYLHYQKSIEIIKFLMENEENQRDLDSNQWAIIDSILKNGQTYPLLLKIMFDIVSKWPSNYFPNNEFYSCNSVKNVIKYLFDNLAIIHGKLLFSRCLFYLTLFENGLSENELIDILSIDDQVLTTVFQYHEPPTRKFPVALWLRIKHDLSDYLTEKDADDTLVITWYHSSFMEVAKELYIDSLTLDERDNIIKNAIDYFIETWKDKPKSFSYSKKISKKKHTPGSAQVRKTKPQDIFTETEIDGKVTRIYNKRKLNELINSVLKINDKYYQMEIMKKHIYFNYEFMHAKAVLKELSFVIDTHNIILSLYDFFENENNSNNDINNNIAEELLLISAIYKENYLQLQASPNCLAHEIMSRLRNRSKLLETYDRSSVKDCALLVINSYLKLPNEKARVVYFPNNNETIYSHFFILNKPFMFVFTMENLRYNPKLYLIDHTSSKILDVMHLKFTQSYSVILIESMCLKVNPDNNCKKINDMIGYMLLSRRQAHSKLISVCSLTFDNETQSSMEFSRQSKSFALNKNTMLVVSDDTIETLNVSDMKTIEKKNFQDEISEMCCNISPNTIIMPEFEKIEKYVVIIIASRNIKLYRLDNERKLSLFWETMIDFPIYCFKIDYLFLIDKMLQMKREMNISNRQTKIRFAIGNEVCMKVFKIYSELSHDEKSIKNDKKSNAFILNFEFDAILYTYESRYFFYDLNTECLVDIDYFKGVCQFFSNTKFVHFNLKAAEFYELKKFSTDYKFAKIYEVPCSVTNDFDSKDVFVIDRAIFVRPGDNSLVKLNIQSKGIIKTLKQHVITLAVRNLFNMLNENHVLALNERELVIINCMRNEIVKTKSVENYQVKTLRNYFILLNNEEQILLLNFIQEDNNQFNFIEIMRKEIETCVDIRNIFLSVKHDRELTIAIENITKTTIDLFTYKYVSASNTYALNESKQYKSINETHNLIITHKSNYILLKTAKTVFNIRKDNTIIEIKINLNNLPCFRNYNIYLIDDSDDFIAYFERQVFYFKCVLKDDAITYKIITALDFNMFISAIMVKNGLIFLILSNVIRIFSINNIREKEKFIQKSIFRDRKIANVHTDDKNNYLVYSSDLKILKLIKLQTNKTIGELLFRENIAELKVNEKYVSVKFENKQFISFIIIDELNIHYKKRLEDLVAYKKDYLEDEQNQDFLEHYLDNNFNSDLFKSGCAHNSASDVKYLKYLEDLRKEIKQLNIIKTHE